MWESNMENPPLELCPEKKAAKTQCIASMSTATLQINPGVKELYYGSVFSIYNLKKDQKYTKRNSVLLDIPKLDVTK